MEANAPDAATECPDATFEQLAEENRRLKELVSDLVEQIGDEDGPDLDGIVSVNAATELARGASPLERRRIAERVTSGEGVSQTADDLHSLINVFLDDDDETALALAEFGLGRFPYSITLLADAIRECGHLGYYERGIAHIERARSIDVGSWDWYLAVHVGQFFKLSLDFCEPGQRAARVEEGLAALRAFEAVHPFEDRVVNTEAEILIEANRVQEAQEILERAIFVPQSSPFDGDKVPVGVTQCCLTYIDLLGSYLSPEKIVRIARRGLASLAQLDQKVPAAAFLRQEAFALDRKLSNEERFEDGFGNKSKVEELLSAYELAYARSGASHMREVIRERYDIACGRAHIKGRELG